MSQPESVTPQNRATRWQWPTRLLGFGLAGLFDGIVLHQVLQWHHLVVAGESAADLEGLERNLFWDGLFHLATWVVVVASVLWLGLARPHAEAVGRRFVGALLVGFGTFHLADQVIFHLLLGAHHIRMVENYQVYDWSFTAIGLLLIGIGMVMARGTPTSASTRRG